MKNVTQEKQRGINWTEHKILEDLDYADDLGLLAHRHREVQEKAGKLHKTASTIGLRQNRNDALGKTIAERRWIWLGPRPNNKGRADMETNRKKKQRAPQRDLEKNDTERPKREGADPGHSTGGSCR
ncbi:hypothetical protein Bbelb_110750 [Branchiostoma belcheri]|nr:hypothetical protein Bbelb_110750 [Branchiostoma belcheri]